MFRTIPPIIYWIQGSAPDESFMRNNSFVRKSILRAIERFAIMGSSKFIYVSESMKSYYESMYPVNNKKSIVVPCLSEFEEVSIDSPKIPNSYIYVGGLAKWQCFEDILSVYKRIQTDNSIFHIITFNTEEAKNLVIKEGIDLSRVKIYSVTDRLEMPKILSQFQFGFLIRRNSPVNFVASPIKFLEYISCNVNVIMTDAIPSYAKIVKENNIGTIVDIHNMDSISILPYNPDAYKVFESKFTRKNFVKKYHSLLLN